MSSAHKNLSHFSGEIPNAAAFRFGIIVSEWNTEITSALLQGAVDALLKAGAKQENIFTHWDKVPEQKVYQRTKEWLYMLLSPHRITLGLRLMQVIVACQFDNKSMLCHNTYLNNKGPI